MGARYRGKHVAAFSATRPRLGDGRRARELSRVPAREPLSGRGGMGPRWAVGLFVAAAIVPLAWRRRLPLVVVVVVVAAATIQSFTVGDWPSFQVFVALVIALYSAAAHCDRRGALASAAVTATGVAGNQIAQIVDGESLSDVPGPWILLGAVWIGGERCAVGSSSRSGLPSTRSRSTAAARRTRGTRSPRNGHESRESSTTSSLTRSASSSFRRRRLSAYSRGSRPPRASR